ncbi:4-hydroxybenzoate polyprenyl transferase [Mycena indigotica]|uniref:4-hydroxybenzoate polyprenyltransferase, mitochondrial n=1 Tax=Mycena indigotica TaxID=2126181 RepID=A0A8H6S5T5_9AGAR|nr:4-hydroxybenzoate polyprenyl transferase [Mycena indigotica]KAF7292755.1 4-hydroxybenzoate polyprenyl transferase [Mycena indigotica]
MSADAVASIALPPNAAAPSPANLKSISWSHTIAASFQPWISLTRVKFYSGAMLVFWPYAWSLTMTARTAQLPVDRFFYLLICGYIGAALSHSAGCVWNDILDRDFDRQVERTKKRPIASGKISVRAAVIFLWSHLAIMLWMVRDVNELAWRIALTTMFPLAGFYPLMKRITYWPQAWLGISMNAGVLMAWAFITGNIPTSAFVLMGGTWAWTIWYDTIYACQDKKDDVKAGVKSTALLFGNSIKLVLAFFASIMLSAIAIAGLLNHQALPFFSISVGAAALHLAAQLYKLDPNSPASCIAAFHQNGINLGGLIWAGFLVDYIWSEKHAQILDLGRQFFP